MRRARIVGFALCLSPVIYAGGCASQEEGVPPPSAARGGSTNSGGSGGGESGSTSGGNTAAGKGGSTSTGGTTSAAGEGGGPSGGAPDQAGAGGMAEGGSGGSTWVYDGTCANQNHAQCDDGNPCTDDACNLNACQHANNTDPCADDNDACTDDVCAGTLCTHPDNGTCECEMDSDCDDQNPCTDDDCTDDLACEYTNNTDPCATDNNECTDDVCAAGACQHNANTIDCTDDGTDCTDDVCSGGTCTHPSNDTCECVVGSDCNTQETDPGNCTFNRCTVDGDCSFVDNDYCDAGTSFAVNSFNSSANWTSNLTTPGLQPLVANGFNANLEGNANLYWADGDGGSLIMDVPVNSMAGLDRLAVIIRSDQAGTGSMMSIGVFDGTNWIDFPLSTYAAIPQGAQYATIEIPLLDFGVPLGTITKVRLVSSPTGGEKVWRIDAVEARDN